MPDSQNILNFLRLIGVVKFYEIPTGSPLTGALKTGEV